MVLLTFNLLFHHESMKKGQEISAEQRLNITSENTKSILRILEEKSHRATFFIGTSIVDQVDSLLKKIILDGHEIALYNEDCNKTGLEGKKLNLEDTIKKAVRGVRQKKDHLPPAELRELGFNYVSNLEHADILFPFKRLERSTEIVEKDGISIVPDTISPYSQLPYNDFVFQILPIAFYENMVNETLKKEQFVLIYLDITQFTDLHRHPFKTSFFRRFGTGKKMEDKLDHLLNFINEHDMATSRMKDYIF